MQVAFRRGPPVDQAREANELDGPEARHALADDGACLGVARGDSAAVPWSLSFAIARAARPPRRAARRARTARRNGILRRALRHGGTGRQLVKAVAMSHGLWHPGHFTTDHLAMFDDLPSHTLEGAAPRDPRDAVPPPAGARSVPVGFSLNRDRVFTHRPSFAALS
ncbi:MAG: hypothetical protein IT555_16470 [Acetobacteraceae bacterium]|nr:hypothetical protein [Acetobacteraceae bacterium]